MSNSKGFLATLSGGAFGVGMILVAVPAGMLYYGLERLGGTRLLGLPLMAIFGIMILFGSLALVAMLYQTLDLTDKAQPLALPEGSIRATIALSLIVLFAILSIMLFQGMEGKAYKVQGLTMTEQKALVDKMADRIEDVFESCAVQAQGACPDDQRRFAVQVRNNVSAPLADFAKQLLMLIGTLMTSLTSYYFASRSQQQAADAAAAKAAPPDDDKPPPDDDGDHDHDHDGCDVPIGEATPDHELPASRGAVAAGEGEQRP